MAFAHFTGRSGSSHIAHHWLQWLVAHKSPLAAVACKGAWNPANTATRPWQARSATRPPPQLTRLEKGTMLRRRLGRHHSDRQFQSNTASVASKRTKVAGTVRAWVPLCGSALTSDIGYTTSSCG